jgi:chromosomal replication initiator protein
MTVRSFFLFHFSRTLLSSQAAHNTLSSSELAAMWGEALTRTRQSSSPAFDQWFSGVQLDRLTPGQLSLRARDEFVRDWVCQHFQPTLVSVLGTLMGHPLQVQWTVSSDIAYPICQPRLDDRDSSPPRARHLRMNERPPSVPPGGMTTAGSVPPPREGQLRDPNARDNQPPRDSQPVPNASAMNNVRQQSAGHGASHYGASNHGASHHNGWGSHQPGSDPLTSAATEMLAERGTAGYLARGTTREQLNGKYTFRNFVVGPSNELAHAAAFASAGGGGPRYNPLFICGGTGLGKTHLMHSIAHDVLDSRPNACILYVSAERFTNQFIEALQHHRMEEFRNRYRVDCDLLLVDDIQFLAGREQTQEEFFHTFNALHDADKPIVVSSDKYPQDLQRMPERLISRFTSGLVADIQTPALETRVAIVRKKAQIEGIALSDDVAVLLAQTIRSNVRELEGTLIRLAAKSSLMGRHIDLEFARNELTIVTPRRPEIRSVEDIQRAVCGHFRITNTDLMSKDRHKSVAFARQVAMYLCRQRLKCSFPELGRAFGNRDHTTVMSAVRRVEKMIEDDPQVHAHLEAIESRLSNN